MRSTLVCARAWKQRSGSTPTISQAPGRGATPPRRVAHLSRIGPIVNEFRSDRRLVPGNKRCALFVLEPTHIQSGDGFMFGWAITFLIVALIAAVLGFGGIAGTAIELAKIVFFVAIVLFVISALFGIIRGRSTIP